MSQSIKPDHHDIDVLVIEDHNSDYYLIRQVLALTGICKYPAHYDTAEKALELLTACCNITGLEETLPDLIMLDIHLPGMTGIEMLKEIRAEPKLHGLPVVILTGSHDDRDVLHAFEEEADGFLQKPVEPEDLEKAVQLALSRKRRS